MKKSAIFGVICIVFALLAFIPLKAQWQVYDGSVLPAETGSSGTLDISSVSDDSPGLDMVQEIIDDPDIPGNKIFKYLQPNGKTNFRHYFSDTYADSAFTIVARVKGDTASVFDRAFDFEWRNGNAGTRDKLLLWTQDNLLELDNNGAKIDPGVSISDWHTYRITVFGDTATIFIDENPVPVHKAGTSNSTSDKYFKMGDGSGDAIGGYMDWCALDTSGAYAPGEGTPIPAELYVDGTPIPPSWKVYDGSVLPGETTGEGDNLDISSVSDDSPGLDMVQEIIDDPDIPGNKIFKYLQPNGKTNFRHYFSDTYADSAFTIVARVKGDTASVFDRAFDFEWRNGNAGTRDKLLLWTQDNLLELDNNGAKIDPGVSISDWHTYRITVFGDTATIFIDENPVPVHKAGTSNSTSDKYFKMGDGSSDAIGGYMDWCILDVTGAYAPGEGAPIPAYLYVDGGPPPAKWLVYDAGVLPTETADAGGDTLDISDISDDYPGTGMVAEIINDPDISGNKLFKYLQPDGRLTFRHYFDESYEDSNFTIVTRIKGENDAAYDRAFDIRWDNANAGTRDELRIWPADSTLELEKADVSIKLDVDFYVWHTFRIVVNGDLAEVYLDENPEPVISGITTATTSSQYLKIGDGSSDAIGGYMDWLILDVSGAYGPDQGLPIPEGLFVDHSPEPYVPKWLVYDAGILPSETADCGGDTLDLSSVSDDSPGTGLVEEIIDDPDITGNKLLKYLHPDGRKMYRHYMDEVNAAESITLMARVKGERDATYDRAFDLQWRNAKANARDELRIWPADSTLELEKAGVEVKVDMDLYEWHTYRIAVYGDSAVVFVDEYEEPYLTGVSSEATSDLYIKIGDGSSDAVGGYLDWCILDISGAFEPGEGLAIPAELYVDEFEFIAQPGWRIYDGSVLPTETSGGGDSLDISNLSEDSPGTDMVEVIVDDPDISGNKLFQYEQPGQYGEKRMYRSYFNEYWKGTEFTLIFRTRALDGYDQNFTFQWRLDNANAREDLRFYPPIGRLLLEKADVEIFPEFSFLDWHTYRVAVYGDSTAVYLDEDPVPIMTGKTSDGTSDHYFKFGDRGSGTVGGLLDWMIMDISGAYAPGEGVPIPEGLYVDVPDAVEDVAVLPKAFKLSQNYPNPFNPTTVIQYEVPRQSKVVIKLYDMLGKEVLTMVNKEQPAGRYSLTLDANRLASGIYFYNMQADNFIQTKKMVLLK
ncbi:MAG: T9SS type A sorting domain-containing protein [Fidelibacterota bacterium]